MHVENRRENPRFRRVGRWVPMLATAIAACAPVPDPSTGLGVAESLALIEQVEVSEIALGLVAEAFALGTRATDVQRNALESQLIGRSVDWEMIAAAALPRSFVIPPVSVCRAHFKQRPPLFT